MLGLSSVSAGEITSGADVDGRLLILQSGEEQCLNLSPR